MIRSVPLLSQPLASHPHPSEILSYRIQVPEFRVSYAIVTDKLDALYQQLKPKGVTMTALLAKAAGVALAKHPVLYACECVWGGGGGEGGRRRGVPHWCVARGRARSNPKGTSLGFTIRQ